jgi:RimJ/RimL family protein N-acetyltransferase
MTTGVQLTDGFVLLRPYQTEDVGALHAAALESMAELTPYMPWAHDAYSFEESDAWVSGRSDEWDRGISYDFVITDSTTGQHIGGCGLNRFNSGRTIANLGYWVRTGRTRRGAATAATLLLARFGIDELKLKRIGLAIAVPNKANQRVAERRGRSEKGF